MQKQAFGSVPNFRNEALASTILRLAFGFGPKPEDLERGPCASVPVPRRLGARGVPPKTFSPATSVMIRASRVRRRPVGGTPTGATGTVALPNSTERPSLCAGDWGERRRPSSRRDARE